MLEKITRIGAYDRFSVIIACYYNPSLSDQKIHKVGLSDLRFSRRFLKWKEDKEIGQDYGLD